MTAAAGHLAVAEQFAGPGSLFVATGLIRALIALGCTTAEAMWVIHDQVAAGRYQRWPLHEMPQDATAPYWVDGMLPAGLSEARGRLSVDTVDGSDWGSLGVTLPAKDSSPVIGLGGAQFPGGTDGEGYPSAVRAHAEKLFPKGMPDDADLRDVIVKLDSERSDDNSDIEIIRQFYGETVGNDPKSQLMQGRIRALRQRSGTTLPKRT